VGPVLLAADELSSTTDFRNPNFTANLQRLGPTNLATSSAADAAALQIHKELFGHRFFWVENRVSGKAVDSNRDQGVAFEDVQHCHASLVGAEDGFIAKTVDPRRFASVGGENREHRGGEPGFAGVEDVEYERLIASDRIITPFRIVVPLGAVLIAALGVFDRHAQNSLSIGLGDKLWDVDLVAGRSGANTGANDDRNGKANQCSSHKVVSVEFEEQV
jgi:hypothetical protein